MKIIDCLYDILGFYLCFLKMFEGMFFIEFFICYIWIIKVGLLKIK